MSFTLMSLLETLNHKDNHCQNPSLSQGPAPIEIEQTSSWVKQSSFCLHSTSALHS